MKLLRFFALPLLVIVVLVAAGCGGGSSSQSVPSGSVALVGDTQITKSEFTALLDQAKRSYKARKTPFPKAGTQQYKALQDQAMQYLVQRTEFEQKAKDLGIEVTDKKVDARLAQIKQQYFQGNDTKYQAQLKAQGLTEQQVKDDIRSQLLSEAIFKKVTADVKVSDAEIAKYYAAHRSTYSQPESRDVRHILVNNKPLADKLYAQLKGGADFAALAKKYSKDPGSAAQGGKLTISQGQTVPQFNRVAFTLKQGEISKPVKTQYGWHIIQALSAIRAAKQTPLKDVKESIRSQLLQTKKNTVMTKWVDDVKSQYTKKISYQQGYAPAATATSSTATATTG